MIDPELTAWADARMEQLELEGKIFLSILAHLGLTMLLKVLY